MAQPTGSQSNDKSTVAGHRQRLRERFLKGGTDSIADYELVEMLLFLGIPRRDVKPLAKELIEKFGSVGALLSADYESLKHIGGLGDAAIAAIKTVQVAAIAMVRENVANKTVLSNWKALLDYCRAQMAYLKVEQFRILFLDRKNTLIADEVQSEGTVDHTSVYTREVVKRALDLGASALILVHNHPSGDPSPSRGDIAMTKELVDACQKLDISIHDHIIVGKHGHTSFKSKGLL